MRTSLFIFLLIVINSYVIRAQVIPGNSDKGCELIYKEFYYIQIQGFTKSGIVYMNGVSDTMIDVKKANKKTYRSFIEDLYYQMYYTPYLSQISSYYDALNYCRDPLIINIKDSLSQFSMKESFWLKQISMKNAFFETYLEDQTKMILIISKVRGMFYKMRKNYDEFDFTVSDELDIYEIESIKDIYVPQDIVVDDISKIKLNIQ